MTSSCGLHLGVKRERQRDAGDVPQITLPGQPSKGNKRCKLGPTEQLRVVVRQILAGEPFFQPCFHLPASC